MITAAFLVFILVLATSDKCIIQQGLEDRIHSFLAPFSKGLTREMIVSATKQKYVCLVEINQGKVISDCILPDWKEYFQKIAIDLPNVVFLLNQIDSPRIIKGTCIEDQDWTKCACDTDYVQPDHGFFLTKNNWTPIFKKIPLFGPTTISQCFLDIILPSIYHFQNIHRRKIVWETAQPIGFWRGSSTGGSFDENNPPYINFHRQRLVSLCMKINNCDAKFTAYVQCSEQICRDMKKDYGGVHNFVKYSSQPDYKVLIDIDGNTFSARFDRLLKSGSLVLKIAAFEDMISMLTKPWLHYVPVNMNLSDFQDKLEWALSNQNSIRQIGTWARQRALAVLNNQTYDCYIVRLITEYSKLFKQEIRSGQKELIQRLDSPTQTQTLVEPGKKFNS